MDDDLRSDDDLDQWTDSGSEEEDNYELNAREDIEENEERKADA